MTAVLSLSLVATLKSIFPNNTNVEVHVVFGVAIAATVGEPLLGAKLHERVYRTTRFHYIYFALVRVNFDANFTLSVQQLTPCFNLRLIELLNCPLFRKLGESRELPIRRLDILGEEKSILRMLRWRTYY